MATRLVTVDPDSIVEFCKAHPVDLKDAWSDVTRRGGTGDVMPPSPAADAFFTLYLEVNKSTLPTQAEYADYCCDIWAHWFNQLPSLVQQSFRARIYRQFYPSFIDSIHVWSLLGTRFYADGHLVFDRCLIDTYADVVKNSDLLVYRGDECLRIALRADTKNAREAEEYKRRYRQSRDAQAGERLVTLLLPIVNRAKVGGKRWFCWPDDFRPLFRKVEQLWLPGIETQGINLENVYAGVCQGSPGNPTMPV